jgi:calcineurin-like phosphoesterase family protein
MSPLGYEGRGVEASALLRGLRGLCVLACVAIGGCGGGNATTGPSQPPIVPPGDPGVTTTIPPTGGPVTFVGAGDIAMCDALDPARQTGQLIRGIGGTVFTLGDNAYFGGTEREFHDCYDPAWGSEKFRTRPTLGNHEYEGGNAGVPYFTYFGTQAGPAGLGYYSFELSPGWHAIALNSNLPMTDGSAQGQWLRSDLAGNRSRCTVAYWHHPLYSSSQNGPQPAARDLYRQLYTAGADLILAGHDHAYERFGPQDPDGHLDTQRGIRQFVVGTGGATLYNFNPPMANSEVRIRAWGVLRLTLDNDRYDWQFIEIGGAVRDSGSGTCH